MITVEAARLGLSAIECALAVETVPLADALSRTLADDVEAVVDVPPADNSAMDGFAVDSQDLAEPPTVLPVSQRIPAGTAPNDLSSGSAARIFTGGVIPKGADAVVIQENCEFTRDSDSVTILKTVSSGENIRVQGQDIKRGAQVLSAGTQLNAIDLASLASIGCAEVTVYRRLRVAIFSTGNELVEPGKPLKAGQIYNSNRTLLTALCEQLGFTTVDCGIVEDSLAATKEALKQAAEQADVILTSGGVSVGEEDYIKPAIKQLGEIELWKVQMKPGKPVVWGNITSDDRATPILGLPGNPVSSFVVFQLLGIPLLRALQGQKAESATEYIVAAGFSKTKVSREEYIRVKLEKDAAGQLTAQRYSNQSSGVMSSLAWADGLVRQRIEQAIQIGDQLEFLPLNNGLL